MKKLLIVLGILVLALLVIFVVSVFTHKTSTATTSNSGSSVTNSFPLSQTSSTQTSGSNSSDQLLTVKTTTGSTVAVKNFEISPSTVKDPSNQGYYYLSGGANVVTSKAPYQIFYDSQYDYFGITLYKEPLGQYRQQAELELEQALGLTQDQMCDLNYDISAGPGINDLYSSENVGFSFCPGAVALPQ